MFKTSSLRRVLSAVHVSRHRCEYLDPDWGVLTGGQFDQVIEESFAFHNRVRLLLGGGHRLIFLDCIVYDRIPEPSRMNERNIGNFGGLQKGADNFHWLLSFVLKYLNKRPHPSNHTAL